MAKDKPVSENTRWILLSWSRWWFHRARSSSLFSKILASRMFLHDFGCLIRCNWTELNCTRSLNPAFKRSFNSSSVESTQGSVFTSESTEDIPLCKVSALHWREAIRVGSPLGPSTDMMDEAGGAWDATSNCEPSKMCINSKWDSKQHEICSKLWDSFAKLWQKPVNHNCSFRNGFFSHSIASGSECTQEVCTGISATPLLGFQVAYQTAKMATKCPWNLKSVFLLKTLK